MSTFDDLPHPAHDGLPLTGIPRRGLPERVIVVGDPFRVAKMAGVLEDVQPVSHVREFRTIRGVWKGVEVAVASHGVGAPGALCLFHELAEAGATTVIRLGTCGSMAKGIADGDLIVATSAVRDDGVTQQLVPDQYPAASTPAVVTALSAAARVHGAPFHEGVVWTRAAFYPEMIDLPILQYAAHGVLAIEMELSALLVLASLRGQRAGGVLVVDGSAVDQLDEDHEYDPNRTVVHRGVEAAMHVALDTLVALG